MEDPVFVNQRERRSDADTRDGSCARPTVQPAPPAPAVSYKWDKIEITVETKYGNNFAILQRLTQAGHHSPRCRRRPGRHGALCDSTASQWSTSQDEELTQKTIDATVRTLPEEPTPGFWSPATPIPITAAAWLWSRSRARGSVRPGRSAAWE